MAHSPKVFPFLFQLFSTMLFSSICSVNQPMITDDGDTADYRHLEIYFYSTIESAPLTSWWTAPALEFDYGLTPRIELHMIIPYLTVIPHPARRASGFSDFEVGFKATLLTESKYLPKVSFAPVVELPVGSAKRNLGNGRSWYKFPLWIEKNWQAWSTYGGGGYIYNGEPGMDNAYFGGWVIQRNYSERLLISAEIYTQTALAKSFGQVLQDQGAVTLLNVGINYQWLRQLAVQVSAGHNIFGVQQWYSYMGLFYDLTV